MFWFVLGNVIIFCHMWVNHYFPSLLTPLLAWDSSKDTVLHGDTACPKRLQHHSVKPLRWGEQDLATVKERVPLKPASFLLPSHGSTFYELWPFYHCCMVFSGTDALLPRAQTAPSMKPVSQLPSWPSLRHNTVHACVYCRDKAQDRDICMDEGKGASADTFSPVLSTLTWLCAWPDTSKAAQIR